MQDFTSLAHPFFDAVNLHFGWPCAKWSETTTHSSTHERIYKALVTTLVTSLNMPYVTPKLWELKQATGSYMIKVLDLMTIARAKSPQKNKLLHYMWIQKTHFISLTINLAYKYQQKRNIESFTQLSISMKTSKNILKLSKARRDRIYIYGDIIV